MLALSQIIVGVCDLDAATARFRAMGFDVLDGGVHPGIGTANRLIPLGSQYVELLGVVSPTLARESEYGRSLLRATAGGDRLVRWSLRTDSIEEVAARLQLAVERRRRVRPDRVELTWRAAGLSVSLADATMPFFMQWDHDEQYPGALKATHENGAYTVTSLSLTPGDDRQFFSWTEGAEVPLRLLSGEPGLWSFGVETSRGELIIRG
jgi:hypothetical protein